MGGLCWLLWDDWSCGTSPALWGGVVVCLKVVDLWWCQEGVECLELTEADVKVCVDEDVGWADCAVGVAACMQPGDCRCKAVGPGDQDLTTWLFF